MPTSIQEPLTVRPKFQLLGALNQGNAIKAVDKKRLAAKALTQRELSEYAQAYKWREVAEIKWILGHKGSISRYDKRQRNMSQHSKRLNR